ncbi:MAG: type III secretory pathway component EscU [Congregibacter sp.]|jgi:type III secretory pathway component EscU
MNRWLSRYLSLLMSIYTFLIILLILLRADVLRAQHILNQANETINVVNLVAVTSQLVHESQEKRGISAGFIGSSATNLASTINK